MDGAQMEVILVLIGVAIAIGLPVGAVMGMVALSKVRELSQRIADLQNEVNALRRRSNVPASASPPATAQTSVSSDVAAAIPPAVDPATVPLVPPQVARVDTVLLAVAQVDQVDQVEMRNATAPPSSDTALVALASTPLVTMPAALVEPPSLAAEEPPASVIPSPEPPPSLASPLEPSPLDAAPSSPVSPLPMPEPAHSPLPVAPSRSVATSAALDFEALVGKRWLT